MALAMCRIGRIYRSFVIVAALSLAVLVTVSATAYFRDNARLSELARSLTAKCSTEDEKVDAVAEFVTNVEGKLDDDSYFLLPIFAPLKPSACQVIEGGGDCAFCARAFIVLMRRLDIRATKLCLHDQSGIPRHAVARVDTARGPLIVDLLFGIIYRHEDGVPMTIDYIERNHAQIIRQQVHIGNKRAEKYPLERYPYSHVTTINWEKGLAWKTLRSFLNLFMTDDAIATISRPYISEEPALMIVVASVIAFLVLMLPVVVTKSVGQLRRRIAHRQSRHVTVEG